MACTTIPGHLSFSFLNFIIYLFLAMLDLCCYAWVFFSCGEWGLFSSFCCFSVAQSCLALCDPMDCSTPGFPVLHHLPEFAQIHIHCVGDALQPSHPLPSPSPPALNLSQHQSPVVCGLIVMASPVAEHRLQQLWFMGLVAPRHVGSSRTRDRTHVPCIGRSILNHWTTREVPR